MYVCIQLILRLRLKASIDLSMIRKCYRLPRKPQNFICIKINWLYALVLTESVALNQLTLFLLEYFYNSLELDTVFYYWWLSHIFTDHIGKKLKFPLKHWRDFVLVTRLVCNVVIYLIALKRSLEFQGYQPKTFPLQPSPRQMIPSPRRLSLPPNFSSEWKNIGSKRQQHESINANSEENTTNHKRFRQSLNMPEIETWIVSLSHIHHSSHTCIIELLCFFT